MAMLASYDKDAYLAMLASYDKDAYLAMLASQSSHALVDPVRREGLLAGIGGLIDEQREGTVTKEYVTVLAAARRASG